MIGRIVRFFGVCLLVNHANGVDYKTALALARRAWDDVR